MKLGMCTERLSPICSRHFPIPSSASKYPTKAQETVWLRFQTMFEPVTPKHIASIPAGELHDISMRKSTYIKSVADSVMDGAWIWNIFKQCLMPTCASNWFR